MRYNVISQGVGARHAVPLRVYSRKRELLYFCSRSNIYRCLCSSRCYGQTFDDQLDLAYAVIDGI